MTYMINDNGVDRKMTKAEEEAIKELQQEQMTQAEAKRAEAEAKAAAKSALLERLGITEEEARLLLS